MRFPSFSGEESSSDCDAVEQYCSRQIVLIKEICMLDVDRRRICGKVK
jgi:hypothetical protein